MKKLLLLSNTALLDHCVPSHPENSQRLKAILEGLKNSPYLDLSVERLATFEELTSVHTNEYVEKVFSLEGKEASLDEETLLTAGSVRAAKMAAGIGLELTEQILSGKVQTGFALVRPPGHHAKSSEGMGFCIFNNIAIAAKKALSLGLKRILILDFDVHHGNGTEEMFFGDDRVLFVDLHQDNLFPLGSGEKSISNIINIPLPPDSTDDDYLTVFNTVVKPLALKYKPEIILVSAGFDAHESDPLGFMKITTEGYGLLVSKIKDLASGVCGGKLLFFLEGGYDTHCLAKNVLESVRVLATT